MLELLCSLSALCVSDRSLPPVRLSGMAYTYWPGDGSSGERFGCVREARRLLGSARLRDDVPALALRPEHGVPCGAVVIVESLGERARTAAIRLDSGPYGRSSRDPTRYAGVVDLLPMVGAAIGLPGRGRVRKGLVRLRWW